MATEQFSEKAAANSRLVCDVLEKEVGTPVQADDTFRSLQINSIDFIRVIVALEQQFNVRFDNATINYDAFETVADLINYVTDRTI